ncbi:adenylate/guanylate cyclase domain-containing protein [Magnetococcus sp. PR-3]|uniref:adenylate/guanylate cyclase domain-containing protein n=1 Tax=Magnetococcus sp. PR-3 TaxID=3120355 RepID=UPI002FCE58A2
MTTQPYSFTALAELLLQLEIRTGNGNPAHINRVTHALSELFAVQSGQLDQQPAEKLRRILEPALAAVEVSSGRLYLMTDADIFCWSTNGTRLSVPSTTERGIVSAVWEENEPLKLATPHEDERFDADIDLPTGEEIDALLALPITDPGNRKGVLILDNPHLDESTEEATTLLKMAGALALGMVAQLNPESLKAPLMLQDMEDLDPEGRERMHQSLQNILEIATDITESHAGRIYIHRPEHDALEISHTSGTSVKLKLVPEYWSLPGFVYGTGECVRLRDAYDDPRFDPIGDQHNGYRSRNVMVAPIDDATGNRLGVLEVLNRKYGDYSLVDEKRLQAMATQAGLSVGNLNALSQLHTLKTNQEAVLRTLTNGVITVNPDGLVTYINPAASKLTRVTLEPETHIPLAKLFSGMNEWLVEEILSALESGEEKQLQEADYDVGTEEWLTLNIKLKSLYHERGFQSGVVITLEDITREKSIQRTMVRYLDGELVKKLAEEDANPLLLGQQTDDISVLFSDIRGFTSLTERLGPEETVAMLNEYFSYMEDVVTNHKGMVDKYIGDAVMALFGAPNRAGQDADNAVQCAVDMQIVLKMLNARRQAAKKEPLTIGIGVSSGSVITGNIGSSKRMSYTAIGDPVNLSARIESLTKLYRLDVMICGNTLSQCQREFRSHCVDIIRVRGQHMPTKIFAIHDHHTEQSEAIDAAMENYEIAFEAYRIGNWDRAVRYFQNAAEGEIQYGPAITLLSRCRNLMLSPMPNWDGVWTYNS